MDAYEEHEETKHADEQGHNTKRVLLIGIALVVGTAVVLTALFLLLFSISTESQQQSQNVDIENLSLNERLAHFIQQGDVSLCKQLSDADMVEICENNIVLEKAAQTGDVEYCESIHEDRISKKDCMRIATNQQIESFINPSQCDQLQSSDEAERCKTDFYFKKALREENRGMCNFNTDDEQQQRCHSLYLFYTAFSQQPKIFTCDRMSDKAIQLDCREYKRTFFDDNDSSAENVGVVSCTDTFQTATFQDRCRSRLEEGGEVADPRREYGITY